MNFNKVLAIIPARGGSKRVVGKNKRVLAGKPLIRWTIDSAVECGAFCDVLVTTDDKDIADISRNSGVLVPWLRPAHLSSDTSTTLDVLQHAVLWYEANVSKIDAVALLQPTCPFRSRESIPNALKMFFENDGKSVISVVKAPIIPEWCFKIVGEELSPLLGWDFLKSRSQDIEMSYVLNGSIYIVEKDKILSGKPLVESGSLAFIMSHPAELIDIDTEDDWIAAEAIAGKIS